MVLPEEISGLADDYRCGDLPLLLSSAFAANRSDTEYGQDCALLYVWRVVGDAVAGVPVEPSQGGDGLVACLDWGGVVPDCDERRDRGITVLPHELSGWRLAGFPCQYRRRRVGDGCSLLPGSPANGAEKESRRLGLFLSKNRIFVQSKRSGIMTALELQERKNWALEVLQACDSEEAINSMEALARKLLRLEKKEPKRPNCFTVEEVKEMLRTIKREKEAGVYVSEREMQDFFQSLQ